MPGAMFDADGAAIWYTTCDEAWRPDTVWRHRLGDEGEDEQVFTEPDERFWVGIGMTRSRRFVEIGVGSKITSEARLLDLQHPERGFQVVWPRREGVEYEIEHAIVGGSDRLLVLHNDGAENFELVDVPADDPTSASDRRVVVAHDPERRIESVDAFAGHLALEYQIGRAHV